MQDTLLAGSHDEQRLQQRRCDAAFLNAMGSKMFMSTWSYGEGYEICDTLAYLAINTPIYSALPRLTRFEGSELSDQTESVLYAHLDLDLTLSVCTLFLSYKKNPGKAYISINIGHDVGLST
ncbi:hypothetical protein BOTNAR_0016g00130 [Botryotinia narcissicola]|uniref:Uncharacterized protein n=1 Tax=Botryotinia narcissicola TaxID=278944 RepID=A0A4Z1J5X8_9HELO|nr:hypothetical protein BOTNAR_0016g00130 [Botryotinia narcissicola]